VRTAGLWKFVEQANEWEPFGYRKLADLLHKAEHRGMTLDTGLDVLCCGDLQGTLEVIRDSHFHNFSCEP
jgi:hypothetical protein